MKKRFWLSYDLGIDGDYNGFYAWLDGLEALECGESLGSFLFDAKRKEPETAILESIRKSGVTLRKNDRLYLIYKDLENQIVGSFIRGARRRSPWAGCAIDSSPRGKDVA